jgi:FkbM family methyltransferase
MTRNPDGERFEAGKRPPPSLAVGIKSIVEWLLGSMGYMLVRKGKYQLIPMKETSPGGVERPKIVTCKLVSVEAQFIVRDERDVIQRVHGSGQFYESEEIRLMHGHFKGGVFVDVGSNVGNHAVYFAKLPSCTEVLAFEPSLKTRQTLRLNLALNNLDAKVRALPFALGDHEHETTLYKPIINNGGATLICDRYSSTIDFPVDEEIVTVKVGDSLIDVRNISLIKIDTEGTELGVIKGLQRTISDQQPAIFVECVDETAKEVADMLLRVGYRNVATTTPHAGMANYLYMPARR